jgi:hypothetical protein
VSSSCWKDVNRLRDELDRVKRAQVEHPGRLRKLHVNKGVDLRRLERYADGLVLMFDASDTGTASSIVIVDDQPEALAQCCPVSGTWERYHEHSRATQVYPLIDRSSWATFMHDDQVYDIPRAPANGYTSATRSRPNTDRGQDDRRSKHSRSRSRTAIMHPESSGNRRSLISTPNAGYDGDDKWNMAPISQGRRRPRERYRHSISSDREFTMTSGLGQSESVESSQHSRRRRQSSSPSNEIHTRPRSHQSYNSERGSDQEFRGRDTHKRSFQDTQQNPTSRLEYRTQSRSSHSSRHTGARQEQQRRESVANIEVSRSRLAIRYRCSILTIIVKR